MQFDAHISGLTQVSETRADETRADETRADEARADDIRRSVKLSPRRSRLAFAAGAAIICLLATAPGGCRSPVPELELHQPLVIARDVRVLIASKKTILHMQWDGAADVRNHRGMTLLSLTGGGWKRITTGSSGEIVFDGKPLGRDPIDIVPASGKFALQVLNERSGESNKWTPERQYPGLLSVRNDAGRLQAINFLPIEAYIACVLPGEIYPDFHQEAYRAQAVAVRTYALYQMARRGGRAYDVTATEASQVYKGIARGSVARRAREAADYTRGIVATWTSPEGERIFSTYYSSCCGGMTQSVTNCKSREPNIPPLAGGVKCQCGRVAKKSVYRWKPVTLTKREVTDRLVKRYPKYASAGRIERIEVIEQTAWGRPKVFRLIGRTGYRGEMIAENFRLAMGSREIRSTHFEIETSRDRFTFKGGRGFGHAMGMCQWGMQEMALSHRTSADILKHYYPSMHLTRAY